MKLTYRSNDELMDLMTVALSGCRVCKTCKQKDSTAGDRVRYLSANLPGSMNATPIEEAIISGMKSETLAGCKTCATKQTPHEIQTQIVFPSEILIVQVNRYKKSGKELYAILFHIGVDSKSGHYTAAVKGPSGEWVMTNDSRVIFTQTSRIDDWKPRAIQLTPIQVYQPLSRPPTPKHQLLARA